MVQNFINRRYVQKSEQNAGSNVLNTSGKRIGLQLSCCPFYFVFENSFSSASKWLWDKQNDISFSVQLYYLSCYQSNAIQNVSSVSNSIAFWSLLYKRIIRLSSWESRLLFVSAIRTSWIIFVADLLRVLSIANKIPKFSVISHCVFYITTLT